MTCNCLLDLNTFMLLFVLRKDGWLEESLHCGRERNVRRHHWERTRGNWHWISAC